MTVQASKNPQVGCWVCILPLRDIRLACGLASRCDGVDIKTLAPANMEF